MTKHQAIDPEHRPLILIVDDDRLGVDSMAAWLEQRGYVPVKAYSADEAFVALERQLPDLILLDYFMPNTNGLEVLKRLRADAATHAVPVILVSGVDDTDVIVDALQAGANDYVTKPINLRVLLARVQTHLKVGFLVARLEAQTAVLTDLAERDELTQAFNRRSLLDVLEAEVNRSVRYGNHLSLLLIDIDRFKLVNDELGHAAGDDVLKELVERVRASLRTTDLVGRYGGDEFLAILRETTAKRAWNAAERVRRAIEKPHMQTCNGERHVTASIGIATLPEGFRGANAELVKLADKALYKAKHSGRNCVRTLETDEKAPALAGRVRRTVPKH